MDVVRITVTVPHASQLSEYPILCYYGSYGEDTECTFDQLGDTYTATINDLTAYNGVTVLVAVAPQSVQLPGSVAQLWYWLTGNWSLLLIPFWLLIGFIAGWFLISWGNSSGGRHLIVTGVTWLITGLGIFIIRGRKLPLNVVGANQQRLVEGFKWFLRVTETERVKFSQAPKLTPKLFEDFLPYAIVFGVEKEWIKQFEHILREPPTWLHGTTNIMLLSALSSVGHTTQAFKVPVSARAGGGGHW